MKILENYKNDIEKTKKEPLLIEISKKDLNAIDGDGLTKLLSKTEDVYNEKTTSKESTNLIFLNADNCNFDNTKDDNPVVLLETILAITSKQIQTQKNINIAKSGIKSALSYFTGGLIKDHIGDYVDEKVDQISSFLGDAIEDIMTFVEEETKVDPTKKILDEVTERTNSLLHDTSANFVEETVSKKLNLSNESKDKFVSISSQFSKDLSPIKIFSLILQLLLTLSTKDKDDNEHDFNKIIFINNPQKLDKDSLAILSLLFSFAKDLKEKGKHTGISIVYCYSDEEFQPYQDLKDKKYKISKKLLDEQRRFTQRYAMLERPSSDIPNIAVKSSTFVGREDELKILEGQFDKSKNDTTFKNIEIIKADPGIGKTKLVYKHIQQIRESEENGQRIIHLTLLNQVGHSSSNTGLSSLKDSILKEAKRLATLQAFDETIKDKTIEFIQNKVKNILEDQVGINNLFEIAKNVKDAYMHEKEEEIFQLESSNDINTKDKKTREEQFEEIREAIKKLQSLCDETLPIILFIDDLQWIDEDSSEFILKYFTQTMKFNTYIVATQRASDATTALKLAQENASLNSYKISLLQQAGIKADNYMDDPKDVTKLESNVIDLKGLDEKNLTKLISLTIEPDNKSEDKKQKDNILANSITKNLIKKDSEETEYVNTLFAIETINMLCDEKLYSSNKTIKEKLVLQNPLRYNEDIDNFTQLLTDTFNILNKKYKDAFEHANSDKEFGQQFNLMAYAILEERLHILKVYFGEDEKGHGNAAVNTLLFSSLLGTPFNSKVVEDVLKEIKNTKSLSLQPLKEYILKSSKNTTLESKHYEIIEEVYEILTRYFIFNNSYEFRHNLLHIFLNKQLDFLLNNIIFKDSKEQSKYMSQLYLLILYIIRLNIIDNAKLTNVLTKNEDTNKTSEFLNISWKEKLKIDYFLSQISISILDKLIKINVDDYALKNFTYIVGVLVNSKDITSIDNKTIQNLYKVILNIQIEDIQNSNLSNEEKISLLSILIALSEEMNNYKLSTSLKNLKSILLNNNESFEFLIENFKIQLDMDELNRANEIYKKIENTYYKEKYPMFHLINASQDDIDFITLTMKLILECNQAQDLINYIQDHLFEIKSESNHGSNEEDSLSLFESNNNQLFIPSQIPAIADEVKIVGIEEKYVTFSKVTDPTLEETFNRLFPENYSLYASDFIDANNLLKIQLYFLNACQELNYIEEINQLYLNKIKQIFITDIDSLKRNPELISNKHIDFIELIAFYYNFYTNEFQNQNEISNLNELVRDILKINSDADIFSDIKFGIQFNILKERVLDQDLVNFENIKNKFEKNPSRNNNEFKKDLFYLIGNKLTDDELIKIINYIKQYKSMLYTSNSLDEAIIRTYDEKTQNLIAELYYIQMLLTLFYKMDNTINLIVELLSNEIIKSLKNSAPEFYDLHIYILSLIIKSKEIKEPHKLFIEIKNFIDSSPHNIPQMDIFDLFIAIIADIYNKNQNSNHLDNLSFDILNYLFILSNNDNLQDPVRKALYKVISYIFDDYFSLINKVLKNNSYNLQDFEQLHEFLQYTSDYILFNFKESDELQEFKINISKLYNAVQNINQSNKLYQEIANIYNIVFQK